MNKQEEIERIESRAFNIGDTDLVVGLSYTKNIINQINKPQKVVVPKFVAEWIEEAKEGECSLCTALGLVDGDSRNFDWLFNGDKSNQDTFARAWLDGYEIEQEPLYTVEIPNPNSAGGKLVLFKQQSSGRLILDILNPNINKSKYLQLTESEIKQDFDFLWQFAKEVE